MSNNENVAYESDDEENINPKAHKRLLAGVSRLQKNQFIRKPSRDEPAAKRSEFHLVKPVDVDTEEATATKKSGKINVSDLVSVLDKTSKHLDLGKVLRKTSDKKKVLPKPLEKPAADKLQRAINYEKTKDKLARWDAIVAKNRSADHLSFPLDQDASEITMKDSYQVPSKFRIKSDMMLEMEQIEPEIFQIGKPDDDAVNETNANEQRKLSRAEMIERSRELRQLRIKESQKSVKAHHQNKIKSKKYHRIVKKEKMKQQIKEFELLQKTDPEAALRKIEQLDRSRVEERANLRHRNTGTWAKNLQVRAKYDKDVRKELADQIVISRELTAKKTIDESDDDNDEEMAAAANCNSDPFNPWLKNENGVSADGEGNEGVNDFVSGYRKYWQERNRNEKNLKEYEKLDSDVNVPESSSASDSAKPNAKTKYEKPTDVAVKSKSSIKPKKKMSNKESNLNSGWIVEDIDESVREHKRVTKAREKRKNIVDNLDDLFDDAVEELKDKFQKKYKKIQSELSSTATVKKFKKSNGNDDDDDDNDANQQHEMDLSFKKQNKRPKIDEELIVDESAAAAADSNLLQSRIVKTLESISNRNKRPPTNGKVSNTSNADADAENINPNDIAKVKVQHLQTAIPDTIYTNDDDGFYEHDEDDAEYHFDSENRLTIAEAFQDDDIVAEFKREKDEEEKKNEPQEIDLSMPGWGSWSGAGIDPSKQKSKRRLILRFPAAEKRRVDNQGNVVIIENRDTKLQKHLVANLPFPFTTVADYEQSIRAPIGKDFVPATAHRLLIKPAVTTKSGTIIEPMNENMLVKRPKRPITKTDKKIAKMSEDDGIEI